MSACVRYAAPPAAPTWSGALTGAEEPGRAAVVGRRVTRGAGGYSAVDIAVIMQAIADLDPGYLWLWSPANPVDGEPDLEALAAMLDPSIEIAGELGYVLAIDLVPVLAIIGHRVHGRGKSTLLPDDPWMAVGTMLFLVDAAKHSLG